MFQVAGYASGLENYSYQKVCYKDVFNIVRGAALLSSGEGGSLRETISFIRNAGSSFKQQQFYLLKPQVLNSKSKLVTVIGFGTQITPFDDNPVFNAYRIFHRRNKTDAQIALVPIEMGAINMAYLIILGLQYHLPVLDEDLAAGRSLTSPKFLLVRDDSFFPLVIATPGTSKHNYNIYFNKSVQLRDLNQIIQSQKLLKFPEIGVAGRIVLNKGEKRISFHKDSITNALLLGKAMSQGLMIQAYHNTIKELNLIFQHQVYLLFSGKVFAFHVKSKFLESGFILLKNSSNQYLRIVFLNENLLAQEGSYNKHDGFIVQRTLAMFPDSIIYLLPKGLKNEKYFGSLTITNSDMARLGVAKLKGVSIQIIGLPNYQLRMPKYSDDVLAILQGLDGNITRFMPVEELGNLRLSSSG